MQKFAPSGMPRGSAGPWPPDGHVMEVLSEHNCLGWLEGYVLTGRHGLFGTYEAFATVIDSRAIQHAK